MTTNSPARDLNRLILTGGISKQALSKIVGADQSGLDSFLSEENLAFSGMDQESVGRLSLFASQLTYGLETPDDERLVGIIETLLQQFELTLDNLALLTDTVADDLEGVIADPASADLGTKYRLGVRLSYILLAIAQAS